jgi:hypothetical protein
MKWLKDIFSTPQADRPDPPRPPSLAEWFRVRFDDSVINLEVSPPNRPPWQAEISWGRIIRVCFKSGNWDTSDEVYIFTDERPESYLIPTEAGGGDALWDEIIRRKLFDAEMSIEAATSTDKLFCWPPA